MIREDYCSYEIAKLLKEKGFKEPCKGLTRIILSDDKPQYKVTHQLAMKWLREKGIDIVVMPLFKFKGGRIYCFEVHSKTADIRTGRFDTYEEAVEAALKYCLTELI